MFYLYLPCLNSLLNRETSCGRDISLNLTFVAALNQQEEDVVGKIVVFDHQFLLKGIGVLTDTGIDLADTTLLSRYGFTSATNRLL
jgi:hypothetical protein